MHRFANPPKPTDFDRRTRLAAAAVALAIRKKRSPKFEPRVWKSFTAALAEIQHKKCGYCESLISTVADPDVEHFCPKSQIAGLSDDPKDWGREESPHLPRLKGRKAKRLCKQGYWWLAYSWENYLLACGVCNRKWKLTIFPVAGAKRRIPPRRGALEKALLLNPFTGPHPARHLTYDNLGAVASYRRSRYGWETIKTCGLNRAALLEARAEKAHETHELIDELLAQRSKRRALQILQKLLQLGNEKKTYCGMVRTIIEQRSGMTWRELERRSSGS